MRQTTVTQKAAINADTTKIESLAHRLLSADEALIQYAHYFVTQFNERVASAYRTGEHLNLPSNFAELQALFQDDETEQSKRDAIKGQVIRFLVSDLSIDADNVGKSMIRKIRDKYKLKDFHKRSSQARQTSIDSDDSLSQSSSGVHDRNDAVLSGPVASDSEVIDEADAGVLTLNSEPEPELGFDLESDSLNESFADALDVQESVTTQNNQFPTEVQAVAPVHTHPVQVVISVEDDTRLYALQDNHEHPRVDITDAEMQAHSSSAEVAMQHVIKAKLQETYPSLSNRIGAANLNFLTVREGDVPLCVYHCHLGESPVDFSISDGLDFQLVSTLNDHISAEMNRFEDMREYDSQHLIKIRASGQGNNCLLNSLLNAFRIHMSLSEDVKVWINSAASLNASADGIAELSGPPLLRAMLANYMRDKFSGDSGKAEFLELLCDDYVSYLASPAEFQSESTFYELKSLFESAGEGLENNPRYEALKSKRKLTPEERKENLAILTGSLRSSLDDRYIQDYINSVKGSGMLGQVELMYFEEIFKINIFVAKSDATAFHSISDYRHNRPSLFLYHTGFAHWETVITEDQHEQYVRLRDAGELSAPIPQNEFEAFSLAEPASVSEASSASRESTERGITELDSASDSGSEYGSVVPSVLQGNQEDNISEVYSDDESIHGIDDRNDLARPDQLPSRDDLSDGSETQPDYSSQIRDEAFYFVLKRKLESVDGFSSFSVPRRVGRSEAAVGRYTVKVNPRNAQSFDLTHRLLTDADEQVLIQMSAGVDYTPPSNGPSSSIAEIEGSVRLQELEAIVTAYKEEFLALGFSEDRLGISIEDFGDAWSEDEIKDALIAAGFKRIAGLSEGEYLDKGFARLLEQESIDRSAVGVESPPVEGDFESVASSPRGNDSGDSDQVGVDAGSSQQPGLTLLTSEMALSLPGLLLDGAKAVTQPISKVIKAYPAIDSVVSGVGKMAQGEFARMPTLQSVSSNKMLIGLFCMAALTTILRARSGEGFSSLVALPVLGVMLSTYENVVQSGSSDAAWSSSHLTSMMHWINLGSLLMLAGNYLPAFSAVVFGVIGQIQGLMASASTSAIVQADDAVGLSSQLGDSLTSADASAGAWLMSAASQTQEFSGPVDVDELCRVFLQAASGIVEAAQEAGVSANKLTPSVVSMCLGT